MEMELREIPKKYQLTYYCATCCPQNKLVYKNEFKYLTHAIIILIYYVINVYISCMPL